MKKYKIYQIIPCENGVGEWEISPTHETFDTRREAEERLKEIKDEDPAEQLGKQIYSGHYIYEYPLFQSYRLDWNDGNIKVRKVKNEC
jgi:hypothetical protein